MAREPLGGVYIHVHVCVQCVSTGTRKEQSLLLEHGGLCRGAHATESNCILNLGWAEGCVPGGSDALTPQRASEAQPVASNFPTFCFGWCLVNLDSGGPSLSTEVCSGMLHSRPAPFSTSVWAGPHPPSLSFADPVTFGLAGIVRLHEVAGAAAEVATLRVVAELRAGAETQALVDVWG